MHFSEKKVLISTDYCLISIFFLLKYIICDEHKYNFKLVLTNSKVQLNVFSSILKL